MTDIKLEDVATTANAELEAERDRLEKLRAEKIRLHNAIKTSVTRVAYLERVVRAANPTPRNRTKKGGTEDGGAQ